MSVSASIVVNTFILNILVSSLKCEFNNEQLYKDLFVKFSYCILSIVLSFSKFLFFSQQCVCRLYNTISKFLCVTELYVVEEPDILIKKLFKILIATLFECDYILYVIGKLFN